jgi:Response regulator containing CheY-like receiver domain and AraC-type DNA-binding domain
MTYNVLLVDDEPMIRFGLRSAVNWEQEGLRLAGEASNGKTALEAMGRERIDILITDIKMPVMDGIELTREAKRSNPGIKVIFVSSYNDFEYAREAVKLGVVVDYLLKPTMEPGDLVSILRSCKDELDAQRGRRAEPAAEHGADMLLKRLLLGEAVPREELPAWFGEPVAVSVWQPESLADGDDLDHLLLMERFRDEIARRLERGAPLVTGERELVVIVPDRAGTSHAALERLRERLQTELGQPFFAGIAPPVHSSSAVPEAYRWAKEALELAFFEGALRCYHARVGGLSGAPDDAEQAERAWSGLRDRFSRAFASADREEGRRALEQIFRLWSERRFPKPEVLRQAQSLLTVMHSRSGLPTEDVILKTADRTRELTALPTLAELCAALRAELDAVLDGGTVPVVPEDSGGSPAIQLALAYIRQKYREDLSLQEVAEHVHMSKNYFSEQFKRHTGLNFIDYVIRLRIHYARHLLRTTGLKIYEVAAQSGFNSTKHFLKLFKREVGLTPAEYRERSSP